MSNEKRPVGSVGDASMSPRASLTTNVLPSRILTSPSLIERAPAAGAASGAGAGPPGPGKSRWNSMSSRGLPAISTAPRRAAAIAFTSPRTMRSNSAAVVRTEQSAGPRSRETSTFPWSTVTRQRRIRPFVSSTDNVPSPGGGAARGRSSRGDRRTRPTRSRSRPWLSWDDSARPPTLGPPGPAVPHANSVSGPPSTRPRPRASARHRAAGGSRACPRPPTSRRSCRPPSGGS